MGKLITFWSPYIGKAGVTSSMCAIAGMLGMQYPELSVAISHVNRNFIELEEKLDAATASGKQQELYSKSGITALKFHCRQAKLTSEKIRRSAIPLRMKSLYLYPNSEQNRDSLGFQLLTETLKEEFDLVLLDLENGEGGYSKDFMDSSDLIVVVLPQNPYYWSAFGKESGRYLEGKNYLVLLGQFLETSRYSPFFSMKQIMKCTKAGMAGVVPVNKDFFDALATGRTLDFFYKNQYVRKKEENYEFFVQTKRAAEQIKRAVFVQEFKDEGAGAAV